MPNLKRYDDDWDKRSEGRGWGRELDEDSKIMDADVKMGRGRTQDEGFGQVGIQ